MAPHPCLCLHKSSCCHTQTLLILASLAYKTGVNSEEARQAAAIVSLELDNVMTDASVEEAEWHAFRRAAEAEWDRMDERGKQGWRDTVYHWHGLASWEEWEARDEVDQAKWTKVQRCGHALPAATPSMVARNLTAPWGLSAPTGYH